MFIDTYLTFILLPITIILVVASLAVRLMNRKKDSLKKAVALLRIDTIATGTLLIVLWFALPLTSGTHLFVYPPLSEDLQSTQDAFRHLQEHSKALARTTQVLHWFIFFFVFLFLASYFRFAKAVAVAIDCKSKGINLNTKEAISRE